MGIAQNHFNLTFCSSFFSIIFFYYYCLLFFRFYVHSSSVFVFCFFFCFSLSCSSSSYGCRYHIVDEYCCSSSLFFQQSFWWTSFLCSHLAIFLLFFLFYQISINISSLGFCFPMVNLFRQFQKYHFAFIWFFLFLSLFKSSFLFHTTIVRQPSTSATFHNISHRFKSGK